jgi:hypothetical protein
MVEHHFEKSVPYNPKAGGCPSGYHKRKAYTVKRTGTRVPTRCVRSTTVYKESSAQYKARVEGKQTRRLKAKGVGATRKVCPPGKVLRRAYVRQFSSNIKRKGYTKRTKSGRMITVKPKAKSVVVPAACIEDKGLVGKLAPGVKGIGPLRPGELKKHGYVYSDSQDRRRAALMSAVQEYSALGVYRKLDAVAKLTVRSRPEAAKVFAEDRNWIRASYGKLKAF